MMDKKNITECGLKSIGFLNIVFASVALPVGLLVTAGNIFAEEPNARYIFNSAATLVAGIGAAGIGAILMLRKPK